jgi:serine acetyltransferase
MATKEIEVGNRVMLEHGSLTYVVVELIGDKARIKDVFGIVGVTTIGKKYLVKVQGEE